VAGGSVQRTRGRWRVDGELLVSRALGARNYRASGVTAQVREWKWKVPAFNEPPMRPGRSSQQNRPFEKKLSRGLGSSGPKCGSILSRL
jgi:hypothetical protein